MAHVLARLLAIAERNTIQKAKRYLKPGQNAPEGYTVHTGTRKKEARYYDDEEHGPKQRGLVFKHNGEVLEHDTATSAHGPGKLQITRTEGKTHLHHISPTGKKTHIHSEKGTDKAAEKVVRMHAKGVREAGTGQVSDAKTQAKVPGAKKNSSKKEPSSKLAAMRQITYPTPSFEDEGIYESRYRKYVGREPIKWGVPSQAERSAQFTPGHNPDIKESFQGTELISEEVNHPKFGRGQYRIIGDTTAFGPRKLIHFTSNEHGTSHFLGDKTDRDSGWYKHYTQGFNKYDLANPEQRAVLMEGVYRDFDPESAKKELAGRNAEYQAQEISEMAGHGKYNPDKLAKYFEDRYSPFSPDQAKLIWANIPESEQPHIKESLEKLQHWVLGKPKPEGDLAYDWSSENKTFFDSKELYEELTRLDKEKTHYKVDAEGSALQGTRYWRVSTGTPKEEISLKNINTILAAFKPPGKPIDKPVKAPKKTTKPAPVEKPKSSSTSGNIPKAVNGLLPSVLEAKSRKLPTVRGNLHSAILMKLDPEAVGFAKTFLKLPEEEQQKIHNSLKQRNTFKEGSAEFAHHDSWERFIRNIRNNPDSWNNLKVTGKGSERKVEERVQVKRR